MSNRFYRKDADLTDPPEFEFSVEQLPEFNGREAVQDLLLALLSFAVRVEERLLKLEDEVNERVDHLGGDPTGGIAQLTADVEELKQHLLRKKGRE